MQIYIAEGTQQVGPFDLDTIKTGLSTGSFAPTQLAWHAGAPGWEPISNLPGIAAALASPPPSSLPTPAPPLAYPPPSTPDPSSMPGSGGPYNPGLPSAPLAAAGTKPRSILWKIGGFVLGLIALVDGIVTLSNSSHSNKPSSSASTPTPASKTKHFATDRSKYSGDLAAHYLAFSFDYPEDWTLQGNAQDAYVVLKHFLRAPSGKDVQVEFASFSYAYNQPGYPMSTNLDTVGPEFLDMLVAPIVKQFPQVTKAPARSSRFGKYAAEEMLVTDQTAGSNVGVFYRFAIVASPNDSTDGLSVTFISSDMAGSKSADAVGTGGGLQTIRDSFRFEP